VTPGPTPNDKLIRKKMEWAGKGLQPAARPEATRSDRLPPGQHLARGWPVLDLGIKPEISRDAFELTIDGLVRHPLSIGWADLMAMPQMESVSDFHCVTTWSTFDNAWRGVALRDVLSRAGPLPEAKYVLFTSSDGYTTNLPLEACLDDDVVVVHGWNGAPLPAEHGGPVRVIVPKRYGWKSAKWIRKITCLADDQKGFWEVRGYSNTALPWEEDRFS
jgi:DMSO/TMAO reductase YedYZ molybdopterin-dependent catalytic subunit